MMEDKLHELLRVLNAEYDVFVRCLERLTVQQRFLMENDEAGLRTNQGRLTLLTREAADLETERNNIIDSLSRRLNLKPGNKTVGGLLDSLKERKFGKLERLKRTIFDAYEKAEKQRRYNDHIIKQSLDIIKDTANYSHQTNNYRTVGSRPQGSRAGPAGNEGNRLTGPVLTDEARAEESARGQPGA